MASIEAESNNGILYGHISFGVLILNKEQNK